MNKKGQMIGLGMILVVFIAILVGVIFFQTIAQQVGSTTNTVAVANLSQTLAANGSSIYLTDYRALSDVVILNGSDDALIGSGNYTVTNNVIYNGALAVEITTIDEAFESTAVNISGTAQPLTYVADSGGRAMMGLIVIFFALAIVAVALYPIYKGGLADLLGR
jgi:sulfur transfer protein SufE